MGNRREFHRRKGVGMLSLARKKKMVSSLLGFFLTRGKHDKRFSTCTCKHREREIYIQKQTNCASDADIQCREEGEKRESSVGRSREGVNERDTMRRREVVVMQEEKLFTLVSKCNTKYIHKRKQKSDRETESERGRECYFCQTWER